MEWATGRGGSLGEPPLKKANRTKGRDAKPRDYELDLPRSTLVSRAAKGGTDRARMAHLSFKGRSGAGPTPAEHNGCLSHFEARFCRSAAPGLTIFSPCDPR